MLSPESHAAIDRELAKYPPQRRQSALMAALRIAQDEHGWLRAEVIEFVAEVIGVAPVRAWEVATFYSMYDLKPTGRHKISVCTNISCMLRGSDEIVDCLRKKLGIGLGETTADGRFSLRETECLAACAGAPMMQIGHDYHEHLTAARVGKIVDSLA